MARDPTQAGESSITVPSEDPKKKQVDDKKNQNQKDSSTSTDKDASTSTDKKDKKDDELSEEDLQLKNELEMLVERLKEPEKTLHRPALESLRTLIRTSTSSMTSVPKPLKFLRPHYPELKKLYLSWDPSSTGCSIGDKALFAEILSVLAMTYSDNGKRETLHYRLQARDIVSKDSQSTTQHEDPGLWGHEYMRHLASEIGEEYNARHDTQEEKDQQKELNGEANGQSTQEDQEQEPSRPLADYQSLLDLALQVVPFSLSHNAEADAVDLLLELEAIERLPEFVGKDRYGRVCLYMVSCVSLLPPPDDVQFLRTAHKIYRQHDRFAEAMTLSLRLNDRELIRSDFEAPKNGLMRKQLAYMLGRQQIPLEWVQDEDSPLSEKEDGEALVSAIHNGSLSANFIAFGKELSVFEPKSLEDIYKTHLDNSTGSSSSRSAASLSASVDSARGNLASTFVNAFVNAGFGNDKLMVGADEGNSWIYKNKDEGMRSAAASLGVSLLWDAEEGLSAVDKYTYSADENIKAGALMAYGILHSSVRTEMDAALALLSEHVESDSINLKVSAIVGLGIAYAGSCREDIVPLLLQHVSDEAAPMEVVGMACLSLGLIFVGSSHGEITPTIIQAMMERQIENESSLDDKWARFMSLGLALLYLGQQDSSEATTETLKAIDHPISRQAGTLVDMCSYAGTGNVLKIQQMLHQCADHLGTDEKDEDSDDEGGDGDEEMAGLEGAATAAAGAGAGAAGASGTATSEADKEKEKEKEKENNDLHQAFSVIGIALVAMGEDVGSEMSLRHMSHLMHYGEPVIRRSVPLALALLHPSDPSMPILDTLSKYSHDNDLDVAINSILAMGLVGAGTNNARLAQMLRSLAGYYYKEQDCLFMVRIAQGLVHMGKGTIGINPYHTDRQLMSRTAVAGILATLVSFTDARGFVLGKSHWLLYLLVTSMYPRFLITLDEELNPLPVSVRVGKAVDVVGQAGKPRTISGFQTHTTPVRLGTHDRAELATEEYLPYAHVLEGTAILMKNPGYEKDERMSE